MSNTDDLRATCAVEKLHELAIDIANHEFIQKYICIAMSLPVETPFYDCMHMYMNMYELPTEIMYNIKYWKTNGKMHRDYDLPAIIDACRNKFWYQHGKLHRDNDNPAIEGANGSSYWYKDNMLHRVGDNPAIIMANGNKTWYIHNIKVKEYIICSENKTNCSCSIL